MVCKRDSPSNGSPNANGQTSRVADKKKILSREANGETKTTHVAESNIIKRIFIPKLKPLFHFINADAPSLTPEV